MSDLVISSLFFKDKGFLLACVRYDKHGRCKLHRHDYYELVIILSGRGIHLTSLENYPIQAGDVFLIHGDMEHGYEDAADLSLVNILFYPKSLNLPLDELSGVPGYQVLFLVEPHLRAQGHFHGRLRLAPHDLAEAGTTVSLLHDELSCAAPGYRFLARSHLMSLIGFLSRCYTQMDHPAVKPLMCLGSVLSYIEDHATDQLGVAQLAEIAHMSESSLTRVFRKVTGHSPLDYVIRVRIARACALLVRDEIRITEAAFQCGFGDSNYFARQFRRVMGMTAKEYQHVYSRLLTGL